MKVLEGMTINGHRVIVREKGDLKEGDIPDVGKYARIVQLYLEGHHPKLLEQMKQEQTIIPYLKKIQEDVTNKVWEGVAKEKELHPMEGFLKVSQQTEMAKMQMEELIFHDLFPIRQEDLPLKQNRW